VGKPAKEIHNHMAGGLTLVENQLLDEGQDCSGLTLARGSRQMDVGPEGIHGNFGGLSRVAVLAKK